jgi:dipeptidyl aminopeptidase/acylaminoacyl peptidase
LFLTPFCVAIWAACSEASTAPSSPAGERVVEGVNVTRLFARPVKPEIDAILAEWATRDVQARTVQQLESSTVFLGTTPAGLRIVSHDVGVRHVGAILTPSNATPASLPVLVVAHGGDNGVNLDESLLLLNVAFGELRDDFVVVVPSFRSEPLSFSGRRYVSEGEPSPWNRDVDDALALLNVALATTPAADPERIGVLGFSRGACVGLLMAIRDPTMIDLVIEFFGPTDFLGTFAQQVAEEMLRGRAPNLPGVDYLDRALIQPLKRGELTIEEARRELVRRSPVYFASLLPPTQVHHGTADATVPVGEARRLIEVMQALGRTPPQFESYIYEGGGHDPLSLQGSVERGLQFLRRLLGGVPLAAGRESTYFIGGGKQ